MSANGTPMKSKQYIDICQYCMTTSSGTLFQFICCLRRHRYFSSVPSLLVKIAASVYTDWNRSSDFLHVSSQISIISSIFLSPNYTSANFLFDSSSYFTQIKLMICRSIFWQNFCLSLSLHFYCDLDIYQLGKTFNLLSDTFIIYNFNSRVLCCF